VILVSPKANRWIIKNRNRIESAYSTFRHETGSTYEEVYLNASLRCETRVRQLSYCTPRGGGYFRWRRGDAESIYPGSYFTCHAWHNIKYWPMAEELLDDLIHSDSKLSIGNLKVI